MRESTSKHNQQCPTDMISAYLDCELTSIEELELEAHISECAKCFEELNAQKSILLAVNSAFDSKTEIEPPANFAKIVAINAESQISGAWTRKEVSTILLISLAISTGSLLAMGREKVYPAVISAWEIASFAIISVLNFIDNFAVGLGILARSLGRQTISHSGSLAILTLGFFVIFLIIITKLLTTSKKQ